MIVQHKSKLGENMKKGNNWILTYTGIHLSFDDFSESMINIEDIAHALSMTVRFNGHCSRFYSVAEHSVLVSHLVDPEYALEGLLHDASEAYLGDVAKPLKNLLPDYQIIEGRFENVIAQKFNLTFPWPKTVKEVDGRLLADEAIEFHPTYKNDWGIGEPFDVEVIGYNPDKAKELFLNRYYKLIGKS